MLHHEGSLVEAAEVLDRAPGCIVGPGPTAYVLHLNPTPICPFACHGDDNDDDDNDDDYEDNRAGCTLPPTPQAFISFYN